MGEISALTLHPRLAGPIRYALALAPDVREEGRSFYLGTIEYTERNFVPIWEMILSSPEIIAATVGFEEGTDLNDTTLSAPTQVWDQWPLIIGAFRDPSNPIAWTIHEGPEARWFKTTS